MQSIVQSPFLDLASDHSMLLRVKSFFALKTSPMRPRLFAFRSAALGVVPFPSCLRLPLSASSKGTFGRGASLMYLNSP